MCVLQTQFSFFFAGGGGVVGGGAGELAFYFKGT